MAEANVKIAQSLFNMATVGNNVAAAIFWMKARAGWREKHEVTVTDTPLQDLSDAELRQMLDVLRDAMEEQSTIGDGGAGSGVQDAEPTAIGRRPAGWREKQEVIVQPATSWYIQGVPEAASVEEWVEEAQAKLEQHYAKTTA